MCVCVCVCVCACANTRSVSHHKQVGVLSLLLWLQSEEPRPQSVNVPVNVCQEVAVGISEGYLLGSGRADRFEGPEIEPTLVTVVCRVEDVERGVSRRGYAGDQLPALAALECQRPVLERSARRQAGVEEEDGVAKALSCPRQRRTSSLVFVALLLHHLDHLLPVEPLGLGGELLP